MQGSLKLTNITIDGCLYYAVTYNDNFVFESGACYDEVIARLNKVLQDAFDEYLFYTDRSMLITIV